MQLAPEESCYSEAILVLNTFANFPRHKKILYSELQNVYKTLPRSTGKNGCQFRNSVTQYHSKCEKNDFGFIHTDDDETECILRNKYHRMCKFNIGNKKWGCLHPDFYPYFPKRNSKRVLSEETTQLSPTQNRKIKKRKYRETPGTRREIHVEHQEIPDIKGKKKSKSKDKKLAGKHCTSKKVKVSVLNDEQFDSGEDIKDITKRFQTSSLDSTCTTVSRNNYTHFVLFQLIPIGTMMFVKGRPTWKNYQHDNKFYFGTCFSNGSLNFTDEMVDQCLLRYHPDKGGNQEKFLRMVKTFSFLKKAKILDNDDKCRKYVDSIADCMLFHITPREFMHRMFSLIENTT